MSWCCVRCGASFEALKPRCPHDAGPLVPRAELRTGTTVAGRYRLDALLGGGSQALVYRGRHEAAGRDVAIKILRSSGARDPVVRERFLREARAANRIRHRNVVDVTDLGETRDGAPFLVMELLDGVPLSERLGAPWSPARVGWLAAEIARALAAGHALGVVHRDLSPENVVLLDGDRVKVVDFGLASVAGERRLTGSAVTLGTPRSMAPEQVRGEVVSDRADVYALGCLLFEALTGAPPFVGSGPQVMAAHVSLAPPPLPDGVPEPLATLIVESLGKVPASRPSAAQILEALTGEAPPAAPPSRGPSEADRLQVRRDLAARLLDHVHPEGDAPETIASGLRDVARAIASARAERHPDDAPDVAEVRDGVEAELRARGFEGSFDRASLRALVTLGDLARRRLALDEAGGDDAPLSLADAEAVLDAIEGYVDAHPDGVGLLPRRDRRGV